MISKTLFSSNSDEWATPQNLFDSLNNEFNFDLDACATEMNHKCDEYFTQEEDGLKQNWGGGEYGLIHHIRKLTNGLKRLLENRGQIIHWLSC